MLPPHSPMESFALIWYRNSKVDCSLYKDRHSATSFTDWRHFLSECDLFVSNIAFFDSGVGGISVLNEAIHHLPTEHYIYFADSLNVPYGTKTPEQVIRYVIDAVENLLPLGIKALVVASNTSTSIAIEELRRRYSFIIIGMEPAVKPALEKSLNLGKRVLVLATPLTLKEEKFKKLVTGLDHFQFVDALPLPELVQYCEMLEFDEQIITSYFQSKFAEYDWNHYGAIVLGCTHYSFYRETLRRLLPPHVDIIDGNAGTIRHLMNRLEQTKQLNANSVSFPVTFLSSKGTVEDINRLKLAFAKIQS